MKLKLRKRSSEELDDADEDGGRGGRGKNKRARLNNSSPAQSPRTRMTVMSDVSSLAVRRIGLAMGRLVFESPEY